MIVDEVLIYRSLPGGMRSPYTILEEAQRSLTKVIFNPSSSNAGNNRTKQNPESTPPLLPNSSDLAPSNCLGLHPDQQFSSGLATELPPLYFRSKVDDLSKIDSNSEPNQYRSQDEGLPKTNLFSKSSSTRIIDKYEAASMFGKIEYIGWTERATDGAAEELPNLLETLISVFESQLYQLITDLEQQFSEFSEAVTELFDRLYSDKSQDSLLMNQSIEIVNFLQVISWIGSGCSRLSKWFKQPTFGPGSEHDN
ncbi:hypothetical protein PPACK8108_LOCUS16565 [Phakopsora pachyrhizi]|uniref:Uncharacterized protein n=1 Tax=Phakopsora pachyrhizi TaxID=170000 RepID=A0AAV0B9J4_PHAPC|nr:hypothetical protein PPACK8108_LOCUS16565 [Phakopsora pachyrhizi]